MKIRSDSQAKGCNGGSKAGARGIRAPPRWGPNSFNFMYFYQPQRSWAKVMFLQASVILSTGRGLCLSACWDTPQDQTPPSLRTRHTTPSPGADPPPGPDTPSLDQTHPHPPGADTNPPATRPYPPGKQTPA